MDVYKTDDIVEQVKTTISYLDSFMKMINKNSKTEEPVLKKFLKFQKKMQEFKFMTISYNL